MNVLRSWFRRNLSDPQVVILIALLLSGFLVVAFLGRILAPVFAALIIAYLLEGIVQRLNRLGMSRGLAVALVFLLFVAAIAATMLLGLPYLVNQIILLAREAPEWIRTTRLELTKIAEEHPQFITNEQIQTLAAFANEKINEFGNAAVRWAGASIQGILTFLIYLVLVPLMVLFMLKDKPRLFRWIASYLPRDRALARKVWTDVNIQTANYVRGKALEIVIVFAMSFATFSLLGLRYAALISVFVGLSVLIPYLGAMAMTLPIAIVAWMQWGMSSDFVWALAAYGVLQLIDGNVLAPLLLSEVTDLHPLGVILAVLVFGGLWGFWGVFFAIPLATLVHSVIQTWPRGEPEAPAPADPPEP